MTDEEFLESPMRPHIIDNFVCLLMDGFDESWNGENLGGFEGGNYYAERDVFGIKFPLRTDVPIKLIKSTLLIVAEQIEDLPVRVSFRPCWEHSDGHAGDIVFRMEQSQ